MSSTMAQFLFQFFSYAHLPPKLQEVSKPFHDLAEQLCVLPANPMRTRALDYLLLAKDAAVRAAMATNDGLQG